MKVFFFLALALNTSLFALELEKFYSTRLQLSSEQLKDIQGEVVISDSDVDSNSEKKTQKMSVYVTGLHPKKCSKALRKIPLYENYKDFIDFIVLSQYDDKTQRLHFVFDHPLLPNKMILKFKIPRISTPGLYPFEFDWGMFKGLKGTIEVVKYEKKCLFLLKANWEGPETSYPNIIMEAFTQTLLRIALEKLIRISMV